MNTPRGKLLTRAIAGFNFDGVGVDAARTDKSLHESGVAAERKWGSFFSKKMRITSSQILEMAFLVGNLQAAHAKMAAYFLDFLNDDFSIANHPNNSPQSADATTTVELKAFLRVAALAGSNQIAVFVDA